MNERINLLLLADDRITPALTLMNNALKQAEGNVKRVDNALDGLQGASVEVHKPLTGLTNMLANLGSDLIMRGIDAVTQGIFKMSNAFTEAGREQTKNLIGVSDIAQGLGMGFGEAEKRVKNLKESIAEMAAPLPGDTQVYTDMLAAVGGGLSRQFKGRAEEFEKTTTDIVKRAGVLAASHGISGSEAGSVIERLLSGASGFQELAPNDLIQKNTTFRVAMQDQMKQMGIEQDQWKKLSNETRLKIVQSALKIATPDELISRFDATFESVTQGINTYWFNPLIGVFGVMREVSTDQGIKNALGAVTEVLLALTDLGGALTTWGQLKGLSFDPMLALINFLGGVKQLLNGVEYFIRSGGKLPTFNFNFSITEYIKGLADSAPKAISGLFSGLNSLLSQIDLAEVFTGLAEWQNSLMTLGSSIFNNTDWVAVGETIGRFLGSAIRGVINFLATFDYAKAGGMIGGFVMAVVKLAIGILKGIVVDFGEGIGKYLGSIWDSVAGLWGNLVDGVKRLIDRLLGWLGNITAPIARPVEAIKSAASSFIKDPVGTTIEAGKGLVGGAIDAGKRLVGAGEEKPLVQPQASVGGQQVAFNTFNPNVTVTAPNAESIGGTTLETLAGQYKNFISQMA